MDLSKRYELHAQTYMKGDKADSNTNMQVNVDNEASRKRKVKEEIGADACESAPTVVDRSSFVKKDIGADACESTLTVVDPISFVKKDIIADAYECAQTVVDPTSSFANEPPQSLPYYDQAEVGEFLAHQFY